MRGYSPKRVNVAGSDDRRMSRSRSASLLRRRYHEGGRRMKSE